MQMRAKKKLNFRNRSIYLLLYTIEELFSEKDKKKLKKNDKIRPKIQNRLVKRLKSVFPFLFLKLKVDNLILICIYREIKVST
jgi:hypothetical protein